jgi:hypothetical protein
MENQKKTKQESQTKPSASASTKRFVRPITVLNTTTTLLRKLGLPNLPIKIRARSLDKILGTHDVNTQTAKQIPLLLANPVIVFESTHKDGSLVIVSDNFNDNGNAFIGALRPGSKDTHIYINEIPSAYHKDDKSSIKNWFDKGLLRYVNKKRSQKWLQSAGLQLPLEEAASDNSNILTEE